MNFDEGHLLSTVSPRIAFLPRDSMDRAVIGSDWRKKMPQLQNDRVVFRELERGLATKIQSFEPNQHVVGFDATSRP